MSYNKSSVSKLISSIVRDYKCNSHLTANDRELMYDLLSKSTSYSYCTPILYDLTIKMIEISGGRKVRMLCAIRKGDSKVLPISKTKLLEQLFPTVRTKKVVNNNVLVQKASRNIIQPQIDQFRENTKLPLSCPLSGRMLTHWGMVHIDHKYALVSLFREWMDENDLTYQDILLKGSKNHKMFKNDSYTNSWYNYHLEHAILQCVYKTANLSKGSKSQ